MGKEFRYKAFISYSHKDRKWGRWLLHALETYKIPKHLVGRKTHFGEVPQNLLPVFRDRDELPANENLSAQIRNTLINSEFLIVICSPHAATSLWVNKEIEEFTHHRGGENILCLIISGEPNASASKTPSAKLECFPKAFRKQKNKKIELIAADLRKGGDGKRLALLKLVAGMVGIGLDEIIRRDLKRKSRRVTGITLASVVGMVVMGGLMFKAIEAEREAEQRRIEAEGLIEFMLTDLRDKLEPVGRLDVLDAVGEKAVSYYAAQQLQDLSEDSLGRRARAFHLLGEIGELQGDLERAQSRFEAASATTKSLLERDPTNPQRIFEHSQSVFWIGAIMWRRGNYQDAETEFLKYKKLAAQLVELEPEDLDWQLEATYATSNLGSLYLANLDKPGKALETFKSLLSQRIKLFGSNPKEPKRALDLANTYGWLADSAKISDTLSAAETYRREQISLLEKVLGKDPENVYAKGESLTARLGLARIEMAQGETLYAVKRLELLVQNSEDLIAHDTANTNWLKQAARHYLYLTQAYLAVDSLDQAEESLARSQQLIKMYAEKTKLFFREKVQLTYLHQLLKAKISYVVGDLAMAQEISNGIIQNMTKEIGEGSAASDAFQILSEAFLLAGLSASGIEDEVGAMGHWNSLVYLLEPRIEIESPETLGTLVSAYFLLGEAESAHSLEARLEAQGYTPNRFYPSEEPIN